MAYLNTRRMFAVTFKKSTILVFIFISSFSFWLLYMFLLEDFQNTGSGKRQHYMSKFQLQRRDIVPSPKYGVEEMVENFLPVQSNNDTQDNLLKYKTTDVYNPFSLHPRIAEHCNIPRLTTSGEEGDGPAGYKLKSVYTVIRHGDRTTLYNFPHHPNPVISCQFNTSSHPHLHQFVNTMSQFQRKQNPRSQFKSWALYPDRKICDNSFLTPTGSLQHLLNGLHFNDKYINKHKLFGDDFTPDEVNIKITEYSRTYQSAMALLYGFLPNFNLTSLSVKLSRGVVFCSQKIVGSTCVCPAIQYYKNMAMQEAASSNLKQENKIRAIHKKIASAYDMERRRLPFNFAMFDILSSYACHDIKLPCNKNGDCVSQTTIGELAQYIDKYSSMLEGTSSFRKHNSLSSYSLLMDITHHMSEVAQGQTNQKFSLYSGHDKTVAPLVSTLGINNGKLTKYGARVVFELYSNDDNYYIRVLYDGVDLTSQVIFCRDKLVHGLCHLKYFLKFMKDDILRETGHFTFSKACQTVRRKRRKVVKK